MDKRFIFTLGAFTFALATLLATERPAWWSNTSNPVVDPDATTTGVEQNYAPANLGQLKFMAQQAKLHLDANLNGGSGTAITSLVSGFTPQQGVSYTQAELDALRAANYAPINLGQLKAVAKPFYNRLLQSGYDTKANLIARGYPATWAYDYPWNPATPVAENYAPANIGQLKMAFSFSLTGFDSDLDGLPDAWELAHGFDPADNTDGAGTADADGDGLSNLAEFQQNSDPHDYYSQGSQTITPVVALSGGNNQSADAGTFLPAPIKVTVTNADGGAPLVGAPVTFSVSTGEGGLASEASSYSAVTTIVIPTDSAGVATAYWKLGANPGFQQVSARSGSAPAVAFSAISLPADGLWGHWRFFEGAGTIASDTSGFGHPGTLTNSPAWVAGQNADGALSFSGAATEGGTNDYVTMGNPADRSLDFGEDSFTIAVWVKFTASAIAPGQFGRRIVSKGHHGWNAGYCLGINPNGSLFAGLGTTLSGQGSQCVFMGTQDAFNDGQWHHLAAVFDRSTSTARILVDGVRQDLVNDALAGGTVVDSKLLDFSDLQNLSATRTDMPLTIGSHMGQYDFYKGELDDVRLYRRALSDAEIAAICGQTGLLKALTQTVTLAEDTLGTISLKSTGGADTVTTTYEIVTPPANGEAVLDGATISYYPKAHFNGADSLTFRATNGSQSSEAAVAITVTPVDDPPLVSVGGGRTVILPATLALTTTVTDIDTPAEQISLNWLKVSGPGTVTFSSDSILNPTVTFSVAGEYVLRLTATDGSSMRSDSLQVVVNPSTTASLPVVTLTSPANNQAFPLNQEIPLAATVSAPAGATIAKVEFLEGSHTIGESLSPSPGGSYSLTWKPTRIGGYVISAKAILAGGVASFSSGAAQVRVTRGGWFNDSSITAGNEGYSGTGGSGGISPGANSGPSGEYANNGSNGGGPSAGNPGGQNGSDVDSDGDGLTDAEEALRGTIAEGEAGYDTDGDGLSDSEDAVPTNKTMKVKAAPEVSYAIIDLGPQSAVGSISGVNDRGEVLLLTQPYTSAGGITVKVWSNGTINSVASDARKVYGLVQDGTVYYSGPMQTDHLDQLPSEPSSSFKLDAKTHSDMMTWKYGAGSAAAGYAQSSVSESVYSETYPDPSLEIPSSLPGLPSAIGGATSSAYNDAFSHYSKIKRERLMAGDLPSYSGGTSYAFDALWVNDANLIGISASKGLWENWLSISGGASATTCGWIDGVERVSEGWGWLEISMAPGDFREEGQKGDLLGNYKRYSNGFITYGINVQDSNGGGQITNAYASGILINNCREIVDVCIPDAAEGPYFIGYFDLDDEQKQASLWCFNEGNPERIDVKKLPNFGYSSGMERKISKSLVIPAGDIIWRNGRARSLAELTGMTGEKPVWTNLSASLISPEKELIVGTGTRNNVSHSALLIPVDLAVDANRDGTIRFAGNLQSTQGIPTDKTAEAKPFRFWCNDDDDGTPSDEADHAESGTKDYTDKLMTSRRDLEDFSRLWVYVGGLQEAIANGDILVGLKWKNTAGTSPSINIYEHVETDGGTKYLTEDATATQQVPASTLRHVVPNKDNQYVSVTTGNTFIFNSSFWSGLSTEHPNKYLLFEGAGEGKGQLVITFHKPDGTEIGEGPGVWLDVLNVKKMYVRGNGVVNSYTPPYSQSSYAGVQTQNSSFDGFVFKKPADENGEAIIFVHGIHSPGLTSAEAIKNDWYITCETTFKRLWHQGYKGSFAAYKWAALTPGLPFKFNESEYRGWQFGSGLAQFVNSIEGSRKTLIAHSQGNTVCGEALRSGSLTVENYILMQAAVPGGCYDVRDAIINDYARFISEEVNRPTPDNWSDFGYRGYLSSLGVTRRIVNFQNGIDYALATGATFGQDSNWEKNQVDYKPNAPVPFPVSVDSYLYNAQKSIGHRCELHKFFGFAREVSDIRESLAFVARPRSKAVGALGATRGSIQSDVSLRGVPYNFTDDQADHGGQWSRPIQNVWSFYATLLEVAGDE